MSSEVIDLTIDVPLPEEIKNYWIPLEGESVPHLLHFTQYPPKRMQYHHPHNLAQLLHKEDVTNFNPNTLLTLGHPPVGLTEGYQAAIKAASHPIHSFHSLGIQSISLPGYWTIGGRLGVQWDINMIGKKQ